MSCKKDQLETKQQKTWAQLLAMEEFSHN